MDEAEILKKYALFQKSWTNWPCQHGLPSLSSRANKLSKGTGPESLASRASKLSKGTGSQSLDMTVTSSSVSNEPKPKPKQVVQALRKSSSNPLTSSEVSPKPGALLANRRRKRVGRRKPWTEEVPEIQPNDNSYIEIHYEKSLPKGKWLEFRQRQYVANPRYGHIYELRTDLTPRKKTPPPPSTWLWEEEYRVWRLEEDKRATNSSQASMASKTDSLSSSKGKKKTKEKPHADLFAQYHAYRLEKQRRQYAATNIQRIAKGHSVREKIKTLKRNALLGLSRSWPKFTEEYRQTVTRVQARYGIMKTHCKFDLDQVEEFIEKRERYERVFDRMVERRIEKLPREALPDYFRACGLYPTEGEINGAFDAIFKGSGNTADIVFVLDCSASLGPVSFNCQLNFIKDVIKDLDVAPDRVRVGLVPYNESVFDSFGLTLFKNKEDMLERIDQIKFKNGLTRTDLALKMMREIFQSARPGVQKIALVVTDGKSHDFNLTLREARRAQQDNIEIFTIGVGNDIDLDELKCIASCDENMKTVSDYKALVNLKDVMTKRICLGACVLCQHVIPRVQKEGLYRSEVFDIIWTIFVPPATGLTRNIYKLVYPYDGRDQASPLRRLQPIRDACRPLIRDEALEVIWTLYPPKACDLDTRKSRWIRPVIENTEAWSLLDDRILTETDFRTCLKLVIESRLQRDGVIAIPSELRAGVEEVSNAEEALEKVEKFLQARKEKRKKEQTLHETKLENQDVLVQL